MAHLASHEMIHITEHVRSQIACAATLKQLVQQCQDPQLKQMVENHIQSSEQMSTQLMQLLQS